MIFTSIAISQPTQDPTNLFSGDSEECLFIPNKVRMTHINVTLCILTQIKLFHLPLSLLWHLSCIIDRRVHILPMILPSFILYRWWTFTQTDHFPYSAKAVTLFHPCSTAKTHLFPFIHSFDLPFLSLPQVFCSWFIFRYISFHSQEWYRATKRWFCNECLEHKVVHINVRLAINKEQHSVIPSTSRSDLLQFVPRI